MKWFRLYHDFRADTKIKRLPINHRYAFIVLLCLASEAEERGTIAGLDDEDIAFELEMEVEDWQTLKAKFRVKGFIELLENGIKIKNWDKRQFASDSSAARVAKHRDRNEKRYGNVTVTPEKRYRNVLDTETDSKTDPETDSEKQEKRAKPRSFFEEFRETFNQGRPEGWAELRVMTARRKREAEKLAKEFGGKDKALEVLSGALKAANSDPWYNSRKLSFENFASNGKIVSLYEKQAEGDLGQQVAQARIGQELARLRISAVLPLDWAERYNCELASELPPQSAAEYLTWLQQQEVSHAA